MLRDQYLVDAKSLTKVSGQPFRIAEIEDAIRATFANIRNEIGGEIAADSTQLPNPVADYDDGTVKALDR